MLSYSAFYFVYDFIERSFRGIAERYRNACAVIEFYNNQRKSLDNLFLKTDFSILVAGYALYLFILKDIGAVYVGKFQPVGIKYNPLRERLLYHKKSEDNRKDCNNVKNRCVKIRPALQFPNRINQETYARRLYHKGNYDVNRGYAPNKFIFHQYTLFSNLVSIGQSFDTNSLPFKYSSSPDSEVKLNLNLYE